MYIGVGTIHACSRKIFSYVIEFEPSAETSLFPSINSYYAYVLGGTVENVGRKCAFIKKIKRLLNQGL